MVPRKNKKKASAASKTTAEEAVSSRRPLKRLKKGINISEEVVSDKKIVKDEKSGDEKESSPTPEVRKTCTWLKLDRLDPKPGNKSLQSPEQGKEAEPTAQSRGLRDNKRKRNKKHEEKGHSHPVTTGKQNSRCEEKGHSHPCANEKKNSRREEKGYSHSRANEKKNSHREKKEKQTIEEVDDEYKKELGGLIFMCNAKTKPDCFRYQIMGVPTNKKEVVMSIKPGLKFFLYDYDLRVMYGVFEASSAGGMKLEPTAFGGAFPAQVRFVVHKACLPLPESVFKKAIKDSYDEKTHKFKTELTIKQVKNLIRMFNPAPLLHPNGKSEVQQPAFGAAPYSNSLREESHTRQRYLIERGSDTQGRSIPLHYKEQYYGSRVIHSPELHQDLRFLSEQEYRSNGLQQGRHLLPATAGDDVSNTSRPMTLDIELNHLLRNRASMNVDTAVQQREANQPDPLYPSESEYRKYGLRAPQLAPNAATPMLADRNSYDPYDEATTSLVNRYLPLPMALAYPARTVNDSYRAIPPHNFREQSVFSQRSYSLNAGSQPLEFSQGGSLQQVADFKSAPVSQRYSFAGPSQSQYR